MKIIAAGYFLLFKHRWTEENEDEPQAVLKNPPPGGIDYSQSPVKEISVDAAYQYINGVINLEQNHGRRSARCNAINYDDLRRLVNHSR